MEEERPMTELLIFAAVLSICLFYARCAECCTLFAANGSAVSGGGTLICKTRDRAGRQYSGVELYPAVNGGSAYYAIVGNVEPDGLMPRGGINEKGLVVVSAALSNAHLRDHVKGRRGVIKALLTHCDSVESAIERLERGKYKGMFLMLADSSETAIAEIAADASSMTIRRVKNGCLYHTNHYVENKEFQRYEHPAPVHTSSTCTRYRRIGELVDGVKRPLELRDFITFADDRHDGPDKSIWRTGSNPESSKTLSVFAVHLSPTGATIYTKVIADSSQPEKFETRTLGASEIFPNFRKTAD